MSAVKNQGTCGSCFVSIMSSSLKIICSTIHLKIFSAMAVLEYWAIKNKTANKILSEQNVLDCEKHGDCKGGHPANVLQYAKEQGISDGTKYLYTGKKNIKCLRTQTLYPSVFKFPRPCGGDLDGDEDVLREIINRYGPVVISISEYLSNVL